MSQVLSFQEIQTLAPSVFATQPSSSVSKRYAFVPTAAVIGRMMEEGWKPVVVQESRVATLEGAGFQRHMLRFRRQEDVEKVDRILFGQQKSHMLDRVNALAEFPEIVLTNSHNGLCAYQLNAGIYRLICNNGLVVSSAEFGSIRIRHTGNPDDIIAASYKILEMSPKIMSFVDRMKDIMLNSEDREEFAFTAAKIRYGFDAVEDCPIHYTELLNVRREEDRGTSLWNTLNVVQENLMKGRQDIRTYKQITAEDGSFVRNVRHVKTRAINSVNANLDVNRQLWSYAEVVANLKN